MLKADLHDINVTAMHLLAKTASEDDDWFVAVLIISPGTIYVTHTINITTEKKIFLPSSSV